MDVVLKKVSVGCLCTLKLYLEDMIHNVEMQIPAIERDYESSSKYSKDFYRDILKDKKELLSELRHLFNQL